MSGYNTLCYYIKNQPAFIYVTKGFDSEIKKERKTTEEKNT